MLVLLQLPYDVLHAILEYLTAEGDLNALRAFAATCTSLHEKSIPFLWRSAWVPLRQVYDAQLTVAACTAITRITSRARSVRTLNLGGSKKPPPFKLSHPIPGSPIVELSRALRMLTNLEHLIVWNELYMSMPMKGRTQTIASVLDSFTSSPTWPLPSTGKQAIPIPFQLRKLTIRCFLNGLEDFLRNQPMIEELDIVGSNSGFPSFMPEDERDPEQKGGYPLLRSRAADLLPNLRKIRGYDRLIGEFVRGRHPSNMRISDVTMIGLSYPWSDLDPAQFLFPGIIPGEGLNDGPTTLGPNPMPNLEQTTAHPLLSAGISHLRFAPSVDPPLMHNHDSLSRDMATLKWMEDPRLFGSLEYIDAPPLVARLFLRIAQRIGMTDINKEEDLNVVADSRGKWAQGSPLNALVRIQKRVRANGRYLWMPMEPPWPS